MMAEQQQEAVDPEVLETANLLMLMFNSGSNSKQQIDDPSPLECSTVQRGREAAGNESGSSLNLRPGGRGGSDDPLTLTRPSTSKQDDDNVKVQRTKLKPENRGNKDIHQCRKCGEIFEYGQQLGGHMRKHYTGEINPKRKKQGAEIRSSEQQPGRGNSKWVKQEEDADFVPKQHANNLKLDLNMAPVEYEIEELDLVGEGESKRKERKAEVDEEEQEKQRQQLSSNLQQDFMVYSNRQHELGCNVKLVLNKTPLEYEIAKMSLNGEEDIEEDRKMEVEEEKLDKKEQLKKDKIVKKMELLHDLF